ncbi:hypothetical protein GYB61_08265, partial [bacterium]|nr:hypothetical protein [bacterium]
MAETISSTAVEIAYNRIFHPLIETLDQIQMDGLDHAAGWLRAANKSLFLDLVERGNLIEESQVIMAAESRLGRVEQTREYQTQTVDHLNWIFQLNAIAISAAEEESAEAAKEQQSAKTEEQTKKSPTTAFLFIPKPSLIGHQEFGADHAANRSFASALHADLVAGHRRDALETLGRLVAVAVTRCGVLTQLSLRALVRALIRPVYA